MIPQSDVVEGVRIICDIFCSETLIRRKDIDELHILKPEAEPSELDISLDVLLFRRELIRFDDSLLNHSR